jgi:hypothetical protein
MKKTILFAIDLNKEETLVSESEKGRNKELAAMKTNYYLMRLLL